MDANGSLVLRCSLAALATVMVLLAISPPVRAQGISRPPRASGVAVLAVELKALQTALDKILAKDPSFAEAHDALMSCVDSTVTRGALPTTPTQARGTVTAALEACAGQLGVQLPKFGLASYFGLAGIGEANVAPSVSCAGPGYDPRAGSGHSGWLYGDFSLRPGKLFWDGKDVAPPTLPPHASDWEHDKLYEPLARDADAKWQEYIHALETAAMGPNDGG